MTCNHCGGTGEKFDRVKNNWVYPIEDCVKCRGWGELKEDGADNAGSWFRS